MRKLTYDLAPARQGEKDNNLSRMERWERAQGMKLRDLTEEEWVDVMKHILPLTEQEVREYLSHLRARNA